MMTQYEKIFPSPPQRGGVEFEYDDRPTLRRGGSSAFHRLNKTGSAVSTFFRSIFSIFTVPAISILPAGCRWLSIPTPLSTTPTLGRKVTGTLFGNRRGLVSFAVQDGPRSEPALVVEFPVTTADLVREMASGMLRIALECEKDVGRRPAAARVRLFREPLWTMYCNGRRCGGHARGRACSESDWHVLRTVQSVSSGAGVIPVVVDEGGGKGGDGPLLYMRARYERVVGSPDSVAFYMVNADGSDQLSIFILRI